MPLFLDKTELNDWTNNDDFQSNIFLKNKITENI